MLDRSTGRLAVGQEQGRCAALPEYPRKGAHFIFVGHARLESTRLAGRFAHSAYLSAPHPGRRRFAARQGRYRDVRGWRSARGRGFDAVRR
jgi:hypothetical protein